MIYLLAFGGGLGFGALSERYGLPIFSLAGAKGALKDKPVNVEQQAALLIRDKLVKSEGYRNNAYLDSEGILTVGIGHKVLPRDGIKLGQFVSNAQIEKFYKEDSERAFKAAVKQSIELDKYNVDMIVALTEVNFQLGTGWRMKFPNTWSLLKSGKWQAAIRNLKASRWHRQTPARVVAFTEAINRNFA